MRVSVLLTTLFIVLFGCSEWEYPQSYPIILTDEVDNISAKGARFNGRVESLGENQEVVSFGFVWSETLEPTLASSDFALSENIGLGKFSRNVTGGLIEGASYNVRAFIQTKSRLVYGNTVRFVSKGSLPPVIEDFTPKQGYEGTVITIDGQNFSASVNRNIVRIGSLACEVISASESRLKVLSPKPDLVGDFKISVTVADKTVLSEDYYSILGPRIRTVSKLSGRVGDLLTIEGDNFPMEEYMFLSFGSPQQWITNTSYPYVLSPNEMECYVPDYPNTSERIELYSYPNGTESKYVYPDNFTIIDSWSPIGNSTPLEPYQAVVRFGSAVIGSSIFVVGGQTLLEFNTTTKTWTKKQDFPGAYRFYGTCFTYNGKLYYGFGQGYWPAPSCCENGQYYNDLWMYDPATDNWSYQDTAPFSPRGRMIQFVIGSEAFMGFGMGYYPNPVSFHDFWSYDIETVTWNQLVVPESVEITSTFYTSSFSVNEKGYIIGLGFSGTSWNPRADMWEFDPSIPMWTKKSDYPDMIYGEPGTRTGNHGLVVSSAINDSRTRVYEYDPEKDRWIKRQTLSGTTAPIQFSHYINGKLYYASGNVWELAFD